MGPDFSRLVHAAIAAGSLLCAGCPGPGDPCTVDAEPPDGPRDENGGKNDPPILLEARFLSPTVLELRFSKKLAPVNDVQPIDFALSLATTSTSSAYYGCSILTAYQDLGTSAAASVTSIWNVPEDLYLMRLSISLPVTPAHCDTVDNALANGNEAGLFVHYVQGDGASVQDLDGNSLRDIAAPWAEFDPSGYYYYAGPDEFDFCVGRRCTASGMFPNMDAYLPIPCPRD